MAYSFGPRKVVTDGLVLYLDAGNRASYPGSGATWRDLSGNGNNATLTGTSYNSGNQGSIVFNKINGNNGIITNNQLARIGTTNHTIIVWVNNDSVFNEDIIGTDGTTNGDVLLMIYQSAGGGLGGFRGHCWDSSGNANVIDSPNAIGTGNWNMLTQRVEWGANITLFENGQSVKTQALVSSASTSSRTNFVIDYRLSSGGVNSDHFGGKMAIIQVYNRALSASEISQNYNAQKSRFGL